MSVDRVTYLRKEIDQAGNNLRARLSATVFRESLNRSCYDQTEVA